MARPTAAGLRGWKWAHLRQRGFHCKHDQQSNNSFRKENDPNGNGGYFNLGKGGDAWYSNRYPSAGRTIIERISIDSVGSPIPNSTVTVVEVPDEIVLGSFSVNGSGTYLFAEYTDYESVAGQRQLVWIRLESIMWPICSQNIRVKGNSQDKDFNPLHIRRRISLYTGTTFPSLSRPMVATR